MGSQPKVKETSPSLASAWFSAALLLLFVLGQVYLVH